MYSLKRIQTAMVTALLLKKARAATCAGKDLNTFTFCDATPCYNQCKYGDTQTCDVATCANTSDPWNKYCH